LNNATFAGRLGRDAETRQTTNSTATGFSLAVDEFNGQEKTTLWVDCTMWGERGERLEKHLTKGKQVTVSGRVGIRQYESNGETKSVLTLRVAEVTLQGGGEPTGERTERQASRPAATTQAPARQAPTTSKPAPTQDFGDDDIPF
jgi:single-strand DNA-binding protein